MKLNISIFTLIVMLLNASSATRAQSPDTARIQLLNGSSIRCAIERINDEGQVEGTGVPEGLTVDQLVGCRFSNREKIAAEGSASVYLFGGSRIDSTRTVIQNDFVKIQTQYGTWEQKLEALQAIVFRQTERVNDSVKNPSPDNDRVIVASKNGERVVEGLLEGIDATHVLINYKGKSRKISLDIVNAVVPANLGLQSPTTIEVELTLTNGSKISGGLKNLFNGVFKIELPGKNSLQVQSADVISLGIKSDNLVYLSDLTPIEVEEKPLFTVKRGWQRDRSVTGNPIQLSFSNSSQPDVKFAKGIGTQSYSRLVFENTNQFDRFRATVGIDAETKGRGDCVLTVFGDGVSLWNQRVKAGDDPLAISVNIQGMNRISLVVEPGEQFDLADHVDWGMARFTKSK